MPQASPTPLFCSVDQIGFERVALDVPADGQKVLVVLNGKRFESTLIKMSSSGIAAMSMPALSVCQR